MLLRANADQAMNQSVAGKRVLELGCGHVKAPGAIGVDSNIDATAADVIADLNHPLPFADDSFDKVRAIHLIEHLHDVMRALAEIHRVTRAGKGREGEVEEQADEFPAFERLAVGGIVERVGEGFDGGRCHCTRKPDPKIGLSL